MLHGAPIVSAHPEALFLPAGGPRGGQRYALYHPALTAPGVAPAGALLYIHPFAEELNKSRRMAAVQSRAMARAGYAVLQIDLLGCGDSSGDFGDASWADWLADIAQAARWLRQRSAAPLWLWGLRAGCLLAVAAAPRVEVNRLLLWQPVLSGSVALQQFLRLKLAADLLGGTAKVSTAALRARLAAGEPIEIAGYRLSPAVAHGLEQARLEPPAWPGRLEWIDVAADADTPVPAAAAAALASWRQTGWQVAHRVAIGPAFWQSIEIEEAPALQALTLSALQTPAAA